MRWAYWEASKRIGPLNPWVGMDPDLWEVGVALHPGKWWQFTIHFGPFILGLNRYNPEMYPETVATGAPR